MGQAVISAPASAQEAKLPRRDWVVLPLIAIATIAFIAACSEVVARVVWAEHEEDACYLSHGPKGGHFLPNCISRTKIAEGPWVENSYNSCGYRTLEQCGPKPPGTTRIAVLGSSFSYGYAVLYKSAYITQAQQMLTRECRRPVEFQNLSVPALPLEDSYYRTE
jgi:hypothetical protein